MHIEGNTGFIPHKEYSHYFSVALKGGKAYKVSAGFF